MNKELRELLQKDILDKYDNEEYWDERLIEEYYQEQRTDYNNDKIAKYMVENDIQVNFEIALEKVEELSDGEYGEYLEKIFG